MLLLIYISSGAADRAPKRFSILTVLNRLIAPPYKRELIFKN
jgi:hypothetical protein